MELREALTQISEIRTQMARTSLFRGYRSATAAFSGGVAIVAATLQPVIVPDPARQHKAYVIYWMSAAALSLIIVAAEMLLRARRNRNAAQSHLTMQAAQHFLPSLIAGGLLAYVLPTYAAESTWLIPGLWMILFSLGIFASRHLMPREIFVVAGFYLVCGFAAILISRPNFAFSPWLMGVPFAVGQFITAAILYARLERTTQTKEAH